MFPPCRTLERPRDFDPRWLLVAAATFGFLLCLQSPVESATLRPDLRPELVAETVSQQSSEKDGCSVSWEWASRASITVLASIWLAGFGIQRQKKHPSTDQGISTLMFPNTRALLVDHRLPNREQLRRNLESFQVEVAAEANGTRCVDRALNDRFDMIVLAENLPILGADSVYKLLRQSRVTSHIVFLHSEESFDEESLYASDANCTFLADVADLDAVGNFLSRVVPERRIDTLEPAMTRSLEAMQEAVAAEDITQATVIANRLRDIGRAYGSEEFQACVARLEAFLHDEDAEAHAMEEIRSNLRELSILAERESQTTSTNSHSMAES